MGAGSPKGVPVGPRELDQSYRESASLHAERREQRVDGAGQPFGTALPLGAERRARASEVRSGRLTLLGDVTQVQVRGIEELELAGGPIARSQHVGSAGPYFWVRRNSTSRRCSTAPRRCGSLSMAAA